METQPKKTDESVKAGLQAEGGTKTHTENTSAQTDKSGEEKDLDEQVHLPVNEVIDDSIEQDLDEVVHKKTGAITTAAGESDKEIDADDAVHGG